jgi:hypothetical protein
MVMELRLYFEGDNGLKPGFHKFLKEIVDVARSQRCKFQLVEANGNPVQDFRDALKTHRDAWNVLLLDWEESTEAQLRKQGLQGCDPDSIFWMVQVMESWFLADIDALKALFGGNVTKGNPNVEQIPKEDVLERLKKRRKASITRSSTGRSCLS